MCCVEVIIVGHIWCRYYYFRRKYCRSNSACEELSVKASTVDLSYVGVITFELIGWTYTRSMVYKGRYQNFEGYINGTALLVEYSSNRTSRSK